jgi:hypothetical protein
MIVVVLTAGSLLLLGAALSWCSGNTRLNHRSNQYQTTMAAAEAATEMVLSGFTRDFQAQGESLVYGNLASYRAFIPTSDQDAWWSSFSFNDAQGNANRTYVQRTQSAAYRALESQYSGLYGIASRYRVISNARQVDAPQTITTGVRQEVQLATIPIFQFAIFYSMNLEINPGATMNITGRVHGNTNIYTQPAGVTLTFLNDVTAAGNIIANKDPNDPTSRSGGTVKFKAEHDSQAPSLNLPVGTNNTPDAVHAIVELPLATDSSAMSQQRFANKADIVAIVSNSVVRVMVTNRVASLGSNLPPAQWTNFLSTNVTFYNKREGKTVKTTQIDVSRLKTWSEGNVDIRNLVGGTSSARDVNSIYVADMRTQTSSTESGVRVVNGQTLPSGGLTVATPNPLYVKGHYNAPAAALGSTNTSQTKPAALIGDAITVLSSSWNDANSSSAIGSRTAGNTTVNAAFMGGIVPSGGGYYSGGVENFPRFLESWSGRTLTYNGSMVVMFPSKKATAPWGGSDVYVPPRRNWAFDLNFMDSAKLPPGTPSVRALVRAQWATVKPNSTL